MKTRAALNALGGQAPMFGTGPLAEVGQAILANFDEREARRVEEARTEEVLRGKGPLLQVMARKYAEAARRDLFDNEMPVASRFEVAQAMRRAHQENPDDRGLRLAYAHVDMAWQAEPTGNFSLGDVAKIRDHYQRSFPKSAAASTLESAVARYGFNTLPVRKLVRVAQAVQGNTPEEVQASFEAVVRAHGLDLDEPHAIRARAFIRGLVEAAYDVPSAPAAQPYPQQDGPGVASRVNARMSSHDDPLAYVAQAGPMGPPEDQGEMPLGGPPPQSEPTDAGELAPEELYDAHEVMHDRAPVFDPEDPYVGEMEDLVQEGTPVGAPEEMIDSTPGMEQGPLPMPESSYPPAQEEPLDLEGMGYYGQLADYTGPQSEGAEPVPPVAEPSTAIIDDPSEPGMEYEVSLRPLPPDEYDSQEGGAPLPPGQDDTPLGMAASRQKTYTVYTVRGGRAAAYPADRFRATSMRQALSIVASKLGRTDAEVRAGQHFAHEAFVMLDPMQGNAFRVVADQDPFVSDVPSDGQVVEHNVRVPDDGSAALTQFKEFKQNAPKDAEPDKLGAQGQRAGRRGRGFQPLSKDAVRRVCARYGLSRRAIMDDLFADKTVTAGPLKSTWSLRLGEDGSPEIVTANGQTRQASLDAVDRVVDDYMARVAAAYTQQGDAAIVRYDLRPLFNYRCGYCANVDEYLMPRAAEPLVCGRCNSVSSPRAVTAQLERNPQFTGYVLTTEIPRGQATTPREVDLNIRRVLSAVQGIAPADASVDNGRLVIEVQADDRSIRKIRRVLSERFGMEAMDTESLEHSTDGQNEFMAEHAQLPMQACPASPAKTGSVMRQAFRVEFSDPHGQHAFRVSAATVEEACRRVETSCPGAQIHRVAQAEPELDLTPEPAPPPPPPDDLDMPGLDGGGIDMGEDAVVVPPMYPAQMAEIDPEQEEVIRGALETYRTEDSHPGILESLAQFHSAYGDFLESFGAKDSPARHMAEAAVVRMAREVYGQPALTAQRMTVPQVNEQQPDAVSLPGKPLGKDQSNEEVGPDPGKIKPQVKPQGQGGGTSTNHGDLATDKDVGRMGADKPPKDGHVQFDGPGWGQSWTDTDLGSDSSTGDNKTTKSWDSVSKGAPSGVRSK